MAINKGAMTAESYASRATRKPKIEPVPVVSMRRQRNAAMPAAFGLAAYILVLLAACRGSGRELGDVVLHEHLGVERFILLDGGIFTMLFWAVQVFVGGVLPLLLVFRSPPSGSRNTGRTMALASVLVIVGGFAQVYVIVIGGQAWPLTLFPGMEVSSAFHDGAIASYMPSLPETVLGLGGVGLAGLIVLFGAKVLRFLPATLANSEGVSTS